MPLGEKISRECEQWKRNQKRIAYEAIERLGLNLNGDIDPSRPSPPRDEELKSDGDVDPSVLCRRSTIASGVVGSGAEIGPSLPAKSLSPTLSEVEVVVGLDAGTLLLAPDFRTRYHSFDGSFDQKILLPHLQITDQFIGMLSQFKEIMAQLVLELLPNLHSGQIQFADLYTVIDYGSLQIFQLPF